ncbi:acyl-CoA dehydrogenase family protein [Zhengella sp. ZM62]|uniref:acyl-CoA dehydrogenase family protein n=1 Tax=Zhengella sedimenti TaxID=3390035 RepID=UPI0039756E13
MSFDLTLSEDQRHILDAAHTMLETNYPVERFRDGRAAAPGTALAEFGAFTLALPEEDGGAGFTIVEEALLHEAIGRHLAGPFSLASPLAVRMALMAGETGLAASIAAGRTAVCASVDTPRGALLFEPEGAAHAVIVSDEGICMTALDGIELVTETSMGHGQPLGRARLPSPGGTDERFPVLVPLASLLVSAQLLGVARGALELAVSYAGVREQFGRRIGSFQAIKHHCANMATGIEMLSAQRDIAAIALRDRRPDAAFQIAALARLAPRIAVRNARLCIQIHGGIGFSAEADAHLYLKHAHVLTALVPASDLLSLPAPLTPTGKE